MKNEFSQCYGSLLGSLPNLRSITLAESGMGSGAGNAALLREIDQHFGALLSGLRRQQSLRLLDYSSNIMNDADLQMILPRMRKSTSLGYLDLANNQFELRDGQTPSGVGTHVLNFLRDIGGAASQRQGNQFKMLNLTGNPIPADVADGLVVAYRQLVTAEPTIFWPVLAIDGINADLTRTPVQYIASVNGLLELARTYDHEFLANDNTRLSLQNVARTWLNVFESNVSDKVDSMYVKAIAAKSVDLIYGELQADLVISTLNLINLPTGGADEEVKARACLETYKVELSSDNITNRAKLFRYVSDTQRAGGTVNWRSLFKTLTEREQKYRIFNEFSQLAARDPVSSIANQTIMDLVLANLV